MHYFSLKIRFSCEYEYSMYKVWHWGPFLYILDIWVLFNFQWNLTLKFLPWYHYDCGVQVTYFIHFYPFSTRVRFICSELPPVNKLNYNSWRHLQFMSALCRFVHPMSLLQQLKEFLHWDSWVRRASQGEDLPQQHPVRPPEHTHNNTHTNTMNTDERSNGLKQSTLRKRFACSPDKPMNLLGEILIFNNVYCNQFKNQFDILTLWESQVNTCKKSTTLHSSQKRDDSAERNGGRVFLCELNKDIGADSPGRHPLNWTSMRPVQSCPPQSSIFECLDLVVLKRMNYN